jgi:hypothetical protein
MFAPSLNPFNDLVSEIEVPVAMLPGRVGAIEGMVPSTLPATELLVSPFMKTRPGAKTAEASVPLKLSNRIWNALIFYLMNEK